MLLSSQTNIGLLVCGAVSLLLTHNEIECKEKGIKLAFLMFLQFFHHFIKLTAFFSPFFITEKFLLIVCALGLSFVLIQNTTNQHKKQPCILSIYVNKECKQDESEFLRDIIYHLGLKNNKYYTPIFNMYTFVICAWLWYLILGR